VSIAARLEATRLGWWWERFALSRCFRHAWKRGYEYQDTGYSAVVVLTYDECQRCGAWREVGGGAK